MSYKSLFLSLLCLVPCVARAQYDQEINVEGKYVPEFIDRDRIGLFPVPLRPEVAQSSLQYAMRGVVADFTPQAIPAPATVWRASRAYDTHRGYLDLGLGSYLESTLSAGYSIIDSQSTKLGVRLQHNSTSLWKPELPGQNPDMRLKRYDEMLGAYVSHSVAGAGRLDASADWHLGYFNYYNESSQTLNDAAVRLNWSSTTDGALRWNLGAGMRYFGMRRLYMNCNDISGVPDVAKGGRETDLRLSGSIIGAVSSSSALGMDLDAHALLYSRTEVSDYGNLGLTPFYDFARDNFKLRAGARIDLAMNARNLEGERYRTFNIAPAVRADYVSGPAAFFIKVEGGNELHTMAYAYEQDYYAMPSIYSTTPSYSPLDARVGVNLGSFGGFHAGIDIAYKVTFNQYEYGWYQALLDNTISPLEVEGTYTLRGLQAGLELGYDAGRVFSINARGTYQPQNGTKGYYNGLDRPRWTVDASMETNPWSTLKFKLGFDFRGKRSVASYELPHWVELNFGAAYDFTDNFGIWLQLDNLTNRRNMAAPDQPLPGIRALAGISWMF